MNVPAREIQLALAAEAGLAPSAHNTQPARWRFLERGAVLLYEEPNRRLPLADPTGRDQQVALGAAFEGMRLALSRRGIGVSDPERVTVGAPVAAPHELRLVARAELRPTAAPDPLADVVPRRRTYRLKFRRPDGADLAALRCVLDAMPDVHAVYGASGIQPLAAAADRAAADFLREREHQLELIHWLRFSPRDPAWSRDGLTADCLGLSTPERLLGRLLFAPALFARLARSGLHAPLVSEGARLRTAAAFAAFHRPREEDRLTAGRRFYRWWLELTAAGFAAQPVSVLADDPRAATEVREHCGLPAGDELLNVLAIGRPRREAAESPRLPAEELLV